MSKHEIERMRHEARKRLLTGGLANFIEFFWPVVSPATPFVRSKHIDLICAHLEAFSKREIQNLIINVPPGTTKSSIVSVFYPVWDWLVHNPDCQFCVATFDESLATRDSDKSRMLLDSSLFQKLFGQDCGHPPGRCNHPVLHASNNALQSDTKGIWWNNRGGFRFSTTIRSKGLGWHFHKLLIDDPLKAQDVLGASTADTSAALSGVVTWYSGTAVTRKADPKRFQKLITMQRLHDNDLVGYLRRTQPDEWVVLSLPMEFDPKTKCVTPWGADWRTEPGELLCPERFDQNVVDKLKIDMGPWLFSAQCNQDPKPRGGTILDVTRVEKHALTVHDLLARGAEVVVSVDAAFEKKQGSDRVALQVWAYLVDTNKFYLCEAITRNLSFTETLGLVVEYSANLPYAQVIVERKANGHALLSVLEPEMPGIISATPIANKIARATAVSPPFVAGSVSVHESVDAEVVEEWGAFPFGRFDDAVDSMSQALCYYLMNHNVSWAKFMGGGIKYGK